MITTLFRSQTLASLPNSRLKTPIVPGPHTSCVIRISAFTQMLSPACARALPDARARIFSVNVIRLRRLLEANGLCNSGNVLLQVLGSLGRPASSGTSPAGQSGYGNSGLQLAGRKLRIPSGEGFLNVFSLARLLYLLLPRRSGRNDAIGF